MAVHSKTASVGQPAPDFTLTDQHGDEFHLAEARVETPVALVFLRGFSWPFCRRHLSQLRQDVERFAAAGGRIVTVAPDTVEGVARFVRDNSYPFPLLADAEHEVFDAYDVVSRMASLGQRPAVFLIDRNGTVRFDSIGVQQWQIPSNDAVLAVLSQLWQTDV